MTQLSAAIREQRGAASLRKTAAALGIAAPTLCMLESGKRRPGIQVAQVLARWLGWSVEQVAHAASARAA